MHQKLNFRRREHCVVCNWSQNERLLAIPYSDRKVFDFLHTYYGDGIDEKTVEGEIFSVLKCLHCGMLWQEYILDGTSMEILYEKIIKAETSLKKRSHAETRYFHMLINDAIVVKQYFPDKRPGEIRVLDFGMGWGDWCFAARACGFNVWGAELSQPRIEYARANGINVVAEIDEIERESLDFIHTEQVFEHIPSPRETLGQLLNLLCPGGIVKIAVPNGRGMERKLAKRGWRAGKDALHPLEHINCFTHKALVLLGQMHGLTLEKFPIGTLRHLSLSERTLRGIYYRISGTRLYFRKPV